MACPMIELQGISKVYRLGERLSNTFREAFENRKHRFDSSKKSSEIFWALNDVYFSIQRGEIVGIIGRNGAGKSTLLKILSRITEPTRGRAILRGRVSSLLEVGTGFHPELTGRENIYLNGCILGMRKREIDHKFDQIVAFAELERFVDTPVKRYSSGMYVRLAFSIAAHLEPQILLVDEVLAVGDTGFQKKCMDKMGDVSKKGLTILFVSHQLNQIRRLCSRAIWLDEGQVRKQGSTPEVLGAYESSAVSFISESTETSEGLRRKRAARFVSWEIVRSGISTGHDLGTPDGFDLVVRIQVNQKVRNGHHGIALWNNEGVLVWASAVSELTMEPGLHEMIYAFPGLPLCPGVYRWQVSFYEDGKLLDLWYCVPEMVISTIPKTHPLDKWSGVLNLSCDFKTRQWSPQPYEIK